MAAGLFDQTRSDRAFELDAAASVGCPNHFPVMLFALPAKEPGGAHCGRLGAFEASAVFGKVGKTPIANAAGKHEPRRTIHDEAPRNTAIRLHFGSSDIEKGQAVCSRWARTDPKW